MGIMDSLRRAGEQGKTAAQRSMAWGRQEVEDVQGRLRRTWRMNPASPRASVAHDDGRAEQFQEEVNRRAIVSINGEDVNRLDVREAVGDETQPTPPDEPERDVA